MSKKNFYATKDQCIQWVKQPEINPKSNHKITSGKGIFKELYAACVNQLTPEEVALLNSAMLPILFPTYKAPDILSTVDKPKKILPKKKISTKTKIIPKNDVQPPAIDVQPPAIDVQPPAIDVQPPAIDIQPPAIDVQPPAIDVQPPAIDVQSPTIDVQPHETITKKTTDQLISLIEAPVGDMPIEKNTFTIPEKINFKIQKLTEKNKNKLAAETAQKLITEEEILELIENNDFIIKLLESERKLLGYKKIQYTKIINQTQSALDDPLLKAESVPNPSTNEPGEDAVATLQKKLKSMNQSLENLNVRLNELGITSTFNDLLIMDKRKKITNIINDSENGTKTLIGDARLEIRNRICTQIVAFSKAPELYINRFNNYTLMGGAGTGKTKLAGVLGNFFYNLGLLNTSKVIIVTRGDLVAKYVGQTAPLTRTYLDGTLEGVLFIDEAYQLSGCPDTDGNFSSKDFGQESITEIVNYIDKHIGLSVIIAAGYEDKIVDCFFSINEGMRRRFPNNLRLLDYTSKDLSSILYYNIKKMFDKQILTQSQINYIDKVIKRLNELTSPTPSGKLFINQAGDMLNLSNIIVHDLVLNQKKGYKIPNINNTFSKFFLNKGYQVTIK